MHAGDFGAFTSGDIDEEEMITHDSAKPRWERSEYPHPKFPLAMKDGPLPNVIWLRFHGKEVTGWSKEKPKKK